jgi:predicted transcriptional regulator
MMNLDIFSTLIKFYRKLQDNITIERKKIIDNSIIIQFINLKSNDRYRLLTASAIPAYNLNVKKNILDYLVENEYIRETSNIGTYFLTAKGIWHIEKNKNIINEKKLLDFLDNKFFSFEEHVNKKLSDKEKIILFSMIAVRTFSDKSPIDLKKDDTVLTEIENVVDEAYDKLSALGLLTRLQKKDLYGKPGNEHPVSVIFRHTDALPKKTKGLFKALGEQRYYLDVFKNNHIKKDNLGILFNKILDEKILEMQELDDIYRFCCEIAQSKNIFLFDLSQHIFSKPKYDEIIKEVLYFQ